MLNQTLTRQTHSRLIALRSERKKTYDAINEMLKAEREEAVLILAEASDPIIIYRAQGAIEQLKELINLLDDPLIFKDKFNNE
jgi:predicted component of type VI protein secretion system